MMAALEATTTIGKFRRTAANCLAYRPTGKIRQAIESMQSDVVAIETLLAQTHSLTVDQFVDILSQAEKRLAKLERFLKCKRNPEIVTVEGVRKASRDVQSIRYRLTGGTGGTGDGATIQNEAARKFWTTEFGTKTMQVDWERWSSAYAIAFDARLTNAQSDIIRRMMAFAGGKIVTAVKLDDVCRQFGFPFVDVKCCGESTCDCMAYRTRRFSTRQGSLDGPMSPDCAPCADCAHAKEKHLILDQLGLDSRKRFSGRNLVEGAKQIMKEEAGLTRLQKRILQNDVESVMKELIDAVDIDSTDSSGQTALHTAAAFGNGEMVRLLLQYNANWRIFDGLGLAPIHEAARRGNLPAVKVFVEHDRQNSTLLDNTTYKSAPLHYACKENRVDVIKYLSTIDHVALDYQNETGESAVFCAAESDNANSLEVAASLGADLKMRNVFDESPLDVAAQNGAAMSILAIARKIPETVHEMDEDGNQALSRAIDADCVNLLAKLGADVNHQNSEGKTALHFTAADPFRDDATRALLKSGADGNLPDDEGRTPLMVASSYNQSSTVDILLESVDVNLDAVDAEGNSALLVALDNQFEKIAETLLDAEASPFANNHKGLTALHLSCKHGYAKLTERLLGLGVVVDAVAADGKTPLHYAVLKDPNIAKLLVEKGASMYKRDASGDTPLALSQRRGAPLRHLTAEEIELLEFTEASKEDIAVEPGPTCPSMSFADGPGLSREPIHANVRYSFTVFASDGERRLRSEGNDKLKVSIRGERKIYEASLGERVAKTLVVQSAEDGTYPVAYELAEEGPYEIHVTINNEPIQGFPFPITVKKLKPVAPPIIGRTSYTNHRYNREMVVFAQDEGVGQVDVAIVCDTTSSMDSEIARAQQFMQDLVDSVKDQDLCSDLRIAIIAYRDHPPEESTYVTKVWPLTENVSSVKDAINTLEAFGGGDTPEAVADALHEVYQLNWDEEYRPNAVRIAVLIGDAPPHGMSGLPYDGFPNGCPAGHEWLINAEKCGNKNISIFAVHCRANPYGERAFAQIARSSGGLFAKIGNNNGEMINLIKLFIQVQLDVQLTGSKVSDVIVTTPFPGTTYEERVDQVTDELEKMDFRVRRLNTEGGTAFVESRRIGKTDVTKAVESFRSYQRLMSISRNRAMTEHLGKKVYALKKLVHGSGSGATTTTTTNGTVVNGGVQ